MTLLPLSKFRIPVVIVGLMFATNIVSMVKQIPMQICRKRSSKLEDRYNKSNHDKKIFARYQYLYLEVIYVQSTTQGFRIL